MVDGVHMPDRNNRSNGDEMLTGPQAGLILGKSASTVQRMARAGRLPVAQKLPGPNGAFLFRRGEIEELAAEVGAAS